MSDVKTGDRVSIDSFKVGQPRRTGTVKEVTEGLSGLRYLVEWDDGHESYFSPSSGNLIVEGSKRGAKKTAESTRSAKSSAAKTKKETSKSKAAPKASAKNKKSTSKSKAAPKASAKNKKSTSKSKGSKGKR